jgi:hypothetical protein
MSTWHAIWRDAFARALFVATSLTATPATAAACPSLAVEDLTRQLPAAGRFDVEEHLLSPFLALWAQRRDGAEPPGHPDGAALFALPGRPYLVAFRREACLVALMPVPAAELWWALRQHVGPIA